jgi:CheY-like chemotaxis protein
MDLQMPLMDGFEATERIRALDRPDARKIPIIAMTADAFSAAMERCRQAGMDDYITKPVDPEQLKAVLQKVWNN